MGRSLIPVHTLANVIASVKGSRRLRNHEPVEGAYFGNDPAVAQHIGVKLPVWSGCWKANDDAVTQLTWMAGPMTVLSGSADGMARVWGFQGRLLGTLDPNPKNQPIDLALDKELLHKQLTSHMAQTKAHREAVAAEAAANPLNFDPVTGLRYDKAAAADAAAAAADNAPGANHVEPTMDEVVASAAKAIEALQGGSKAKEVRKKLQKTKVAAPTLRSIEELSKAVDQYDFAFRLGPAPEVGPVTWRLIFNLDERRAADEAEAHQVGRECGVLVVGPCDSPETPRLARRFCPRAGCSRPQSTGRRRRWSATSRARSSKRHLHRRP